MGFALIAILATLTFSQTTAQAECLAEDAGNVFAGQYRAAVKTSFVTDGQGHVAPFQNRGSVSDLLNYLNGEHDGVVRNDTAMRAAHQWHSADVATSRTTEEQENVLITGYIVAINPHEDDNDFHVIVRDDTQDVFLNAEVSGLPQSCGDRAMFRNARDDFQVVMNNQAIAPGSGSYRFLETPVRVVVEGSLFFDGAHGFGCSHCPGPDGAKPQTVWEIHPVFDIKEIQ